MSAFAGYLGQRDGTDAPPILTQLVVGGVYELVYTRVLRGETAALPDLLPEIMYVWLAPFLGPAAAAARAAAVSGAPTRLRIAPVPAPATTREDEGVF